MSKHFSDLFGPPRLASARRREAGDMREPDGSSSESKFFAVLSGNFPESGIALPLGNRKVRAAALRELCLYKGKTFRKRAEITLLRIFNFRFVWDILFRKRFFVDANFIQQLPVIHDGASDVVFSIYVGSRKFILPLFDAESGNLLGVAKVYFPGKESADYGENEVKTLDYLAHLNLPEFQVPRVLAKSYFNDSLVVVLSSLRNLKNASGMTKRHTDFLKLLSEKTGAQTIFSDSDFHQQFEKEVNFLKSKIPDRFRATEYFYEAACANLKNKKFVFSLTKREFPFFEMMRADSVHFVIDWEQARRGFPPIFDVFSMILSTSPYRKGNSVELYKKNLKTLFFEDNEMILKMLDFWKMTKEDAYWFFWLFLIDQLYICLHVNHLESAERIIEFLQGAKNKEHVFKKRWLGGQNMKVTISVSGRFYAFSLAHELEKKGYLQKIITSYPKFEVVKYGIPRGKISSIVIKEILRRSWDKLPDCVKGLYDPVPLIDGIFDRIAKKRLQKSDIFFCWSSSSLYSLRKAKKLGSIVVVEYGSSHVISRNKILSEEYEKFGIKKEGMNPKTIRKVLAAFNEADYIYVPSLFVKRSFLDEGVPERKLIHIPFGVDLSQFRQTPKEDNIFRVVFVGGMILRKGVHYLLQAFSELNLPNSELLLIGAMDDEMKPFFKKYEGKYRYIGPQPYRELYKHFSQGSVFAIASIEEGLALVIPQAMACGLPVICTTNTGGEDIVRDGKDGFVIPIRDVEVLKEKLAYLYENPEIREEMSKSAKERVLSGFTWEDFGSRMVKEFERVVNEKHQAK